MPAAGHPALTVHSLSFSLQSYMNCLKLVMKEHNIVTFHIISSVYSVISIKNPIPVTTIAHNFLPVNNRELLLCTF